LLNVTMPMVTRKRAREVAEAERQAQLPTDVAAGNPAVVTTEPPVSKKRARSEAETTTAPPPRKRAKKVKTEEAEVPAPQPAVSKTKARGRNQVGSAKSRKRTCEEEEPEHPAQSSFEDPTVTTSMPAVVAEVPPASTSSAVAERNLTKPPPRKRATKVKADEAKAPTLLQAASVTGFVEGKGQGGPKSLKRAREDDPTVEADNPAAAAEVPPVSEGARLVRIAIKSPLRKRTKTVKAQEAEALALLAASGADFVDGKGQGGPKSRKRARKEEGPERAQPQVRSLTQPSTTGTSAVVTEVPSESTSVMAVRNPTKPPPRTRAQKVKAYEAEAPALLPAVSDADFVDGRDQGGSPFGEQADEAEAPASLPAAPAADAEGPQIPGEGTDGAEEAVRTVKDGDLALPAPEQPPMTTSEFDLRKDSEKGWPQLRVSEMVRGNENDSSTYT
jgi:hypothetical protein